MIRINILTAALLLVIAMSTAVAADQCITCHRGMGDTPSALFAKDIHARKGISCSDCHGGNPSKEDMEEAMDPKAGFKGVPKGDDISKTCATCHSDAEKMKHYGSNDPTSQWEHLQVSVHGKSGLSAGGHIAQCITCHNAHGIVPVKDRTSPVHPLNIIKTCGTCHSNAAFMRNYNPALPIDQVEKYRTSVHGTLNAKGDAKVAECASCHGSHEIRSAKDVKSSVYALNIPETCAKCHADASYMKEYNIPTDQMAKYTGSVHGTALLTKHDVAAPACNDCHGNHGATPPGVESISNVCGTCHALNAELFSASPHKKAFDAQKLPECETCHGNHAIVNATDQLLGVSSTAVCSRCHQPDNNPKGYAVASVMRSLVDSLETAEQKAIGLVDDAEQKGMEISEAKYKLRDARQARLQSRTMVHSFNETKFREVVTSGLNVAGVVTLEANEAIDEYYFRRWGLGIATLIISALVISLYVFIRRIERRGA